ncbi:MAG TPA: sialidase family protein, partial [Gemmatimonadaceae bacterium]|nr:sialidase family protein [Gemmatimonadaceae bacterium]
WYAGNEPGMQFEDMPRILADVSPGSPHAGNLYVGWIEWQIDKSIMLFSRSTDHGKTWSSPIRISTQAGFPRDDNGDVVGFHGVVDADGTIYAVWNWGLTIVMATSRDGGKTFSPSRVVQQVGPPYFGGTGAVPGLGRVFGFPQVGVYGANVYLSWTDFRNGDIDVFLAASRDRGRTWSAPVRVTTDSAHSGRDQFFQFLAVDPTNGDVYVQFFDRRDDPTNRRTGFTLARSTDGGRSFLNYAWSDSTFEGRNAFLGDYTWLTAYDGRVYGIWAESVPIDSASDAGGQRVGTVVRIGTADFGRR